MGGWKVWEEFWGTGVGLLREIQGDNSRNRAKRQVETGCWWWFMLVSNDEDEDGEEGALKYTFWASGGEIKGLSGCCNSPSKPWELLIICSTCRAWLQVSRVWCNECNHVFRVFWRNCNTHLAYFSTLWCMVWSLKIVVVPIGPKRATDHHKQFNTVVCAHVVKVSMM
jgi:hypothetical protein